MLNCIPVTWLVDKWIF